MEKTKIIGGKIQFIALLIVLFIEGNYHNLSQFIFLKSISLN